MQDKKPEAVDPLIVAALGARWSGVLAPGLVLPGLGLLAIALPVISTLAIEFVIGTTLILAGAYRITATVVAGSYSGSWLGLVGGVCALALGAALFINPTAAGAPVIAGLYTRLVPTARFAVFGSSPHLEVGANAPPAGRAAKPRVYPSLSAPVSRPGRIPDSRSGQEWIEHGYPGVSVLVAQILRVEHRRS